MYDGGRCLVRVRPVARRQRGVELERLGHGQKYSRMQTQVALQVAAVVAVPWTGWSDSPGSQCPRCLAI
jgi:hypothetical protein